MITAILSFVFILSGCYTKLMTPNEFVQTQRVHSKQIIADNSYSINYHQSCTTCHSTDELNERAEELDIYGVTTVHDGIRLSDRSWVTGSISDPYGPMPVPYWPTPYSPVLPWWEPAITTTSSGTSTVDGNKVRTGGSTRDGSRETERSNPISSPTYSQPQTPVGGTTPTPSTSTPAVSVAPAINPPAQSSDDGRSRDTNTSTKTNNTNRPRNEGTSRDDSGDRPR